MGALWKTIIAISLIIKISQVTSLKYSEIYDTDLYIDGTLGVHALRIGFHLRNNLINILGYIINRPDGPKGELYHYLNEIETSLRLGTIDVFNLIPTIAGKQEKGIILQLKAILDTLSGEERYDLCNVKCSAKEILSKISKHKDLVAHFDQQLLLNGIISRENGMTSRMLESVAGIIGKGFKKPTEDEDEIFKLFGSPTILEVFREAKKKKVPLNQYFFGYLLPFYGWSIRDVTLQYIVLQLSYQLVSRKRGDLYSCKVIGFELYTYVDDPIKLLEEYMNMLAADSCFTSHYIIPLLKEELIKKNSLRYLDYKKAFGGIYVQLNALADLLFVIDHTAYPVEIVLARDRVVDFLRKALPFINTKTFVPYNYKTKEEMVYAFLNFILIKAPYVNPPLQASFNAIKAYLILKISPQRLTSDLLIQLLDAWLAPDLNDDIREQVLKIKTVLVDESLKVTSILTRSAKKVCYQVLACYLEAMAVLKADDSFKDISEYIEFPKCIVNRFFNDKRIGTASKINYQKLYDIVTYQFSSKEMMKAAENLKEKINDPAKLLEKFKPEIACTKHENLIQMLIEIKNKESGLSSEVTEDISTITAPLIIKTQHLGRLETSTFNLVRSAFRSRHVDAAWREEQKDIDAVVQGRQSDIDDVLWEIHGRECTKILQCYNLIIDRINKDGGLEAPLKTFKPVSPDLYTLNLEVPDDMDVRFLLKMLKEVENSKAENNMLEAAKLYILEFENEINEEIETVQCDGETVISCFDMIYDTLLFSRNLPEKIKVNIFQYMLKPVVCDKHKCEWIAYEEEGSVILNPLLSYMEFLFTKFEETVESVHLQMDAAEIVELLTREDVSYALANFQLGAGNKDNTARMTGFLELLLNMYYLPDNSLDSIQHVLAFLNDGSLPNHLTLSNLAGIVRHLSSKTTDSRVNCEMHGTLEKLHNNPQTYDLLANVIVVDCFTLERCLTTLKLEIEKPENRRYPVMKPLTNLITPSSCTLETCPWLIEKPPAPIPKDIKKALMDGAEIIVQYEDIPLIVQLYLKALLQHESLLDLLGVAEPVAVATRLLAIGTYVQENYRRKRSIDDRSEKKRNNYVFGSRHHDYERWKKVYANKKTHFQHNKETHFRHARKAPKYYEDEAPSPSPDASASPDASSDASPSPDAASASPDSVSAAPDASASPDTASDASASPDTASDASPSSAAASDASASPDAASEGSSADPAGSTETGLTSTGGGTASPADGSATESGSSGVSSETSVSDGTGSPGDSTSSDSSSHSTGTAGTGNTETSVAGSSTGAADGITGRGVREETTAYTVSTQAQEATPRGAEDNVDHKDEYGRAAGDDEEASTEYARDANYGGDFTENPREADYETDSTEHARGADEDEDYTESARGADEDAESHEGLWYNTESAREADGDYTENVHEEDFNDELLDQGAEIPEILTVEPFTEDRLEVVTLPVDFPMAMTTTQASDYDGDYELTPWPDRPTGVVDDTTETPITTIKPNRTYVQAVIEDTHSIAELREVVEPALFEFYRVLEVEDVQPDLHLYTTYLINYLLNETVPTYLNSKTLVDLFNVLLYDLVNQNFRTQVTTLQVNIIEESKNVNTELSKINVECYYLDQCLRSLHKGIYNHFLETSFIFGLVISVLEAKDCIKLECPHKIEPTKKEKLEFLLYMKQKFLVMSNEMRLNFHVSLDLAIVSEFFVYESATYIFSDTLVYYKDRSDIHMNSLNAIINAKDGDAPIEIKMSTQNLLEFYLENENPKYLHTLNMLQIGQQLKQQSAAPDVQQELEDVMKEMEDKQNELTEKLMLHSLECTTFEVCIQNLENEMLKIPNEGYAILILRLLFPKSCNKRKCGWLSYIKSSFIQEVKEKIENEFKRLEKDKTLPLIIRLDLLVIKDFLEKKELKKYINMFEPDKTQNILVSLLLTVPEEMLAEYAVTLSAKHFKFFIDSLRKELPDTMSVPALDKLVDVCIANTKDKEVLDILNKQRPVLQNPDVSHFVDKMAKLHCDKLENCGEDLFLYIKATPAGMPGRLELLELFFPPACIRVKCKWHPQYDSVAIEYYIQLAATLDEMSRNTETPLSIVLKVLQALKALDVKAIGSVMHKYHYNSTDSLRDILNLISDHQPTVPKLQEVYNSISNYRDDPSQLPATFRATDLLTLLEYIQRINENRGVSVMDIKRQKHIVKIYEEKIDGILRNCTIDCPKITTCCVNIAECGKQIRDPYAHYLVTMFEDIKVTDPMDHSEVIPPPTAIFHINKLLIFLPLKKGGLQFITINLLDEKTIHALDQYSRKVSLNGHIYYFDVHKGAQTMRRIMLNMDDAELHRLLRKLNTRKKAVIDLTMTKTVIIFIPMKYNRMKPLKFNFGEEDTWITLKDLSLNSIPHPNKPHLIFKDQDGQQYDLYIDLSVYEDMYRILKATIDIVSPREYIHILPFPNKIDAPWHSVIFGEHSALVWSVLRRFDTREPLDSPVAIATKFGEYLSMTFTVSDPLNIKDLNGIKRKYPLLDPYVNETKFIFNCEDFVDKSLKLIELDLKDQVSLSLLKRMSDEWEKGRNVSDNKATVYIKNDRGKYMYVYMNFDDMDPNLIKTLLEDKIKVEEYSEYKNLSYIIVVPKAVGSNNFLVLLPELPEVAHEMIKIGFDPTIKGPYSVVDVPYEPQIPLLFNFKDDITRRLLWAEASKSHIVPIAPRTLTTMDNKTLIVTIVQNKDDHKNPIKPVIFEDKDVAYKKLLPFHEPQNPQAVQIPFSQKVLMVDIFNRRVVQTLLTLPEPDIQRFIVSDLRRNRNSQLGQSTVEVLSHIPIFEDGVRSLLYVQGTDQSVYDKVSSICKETYETAASIMIIRPDKQREEIYCKLDDSKVVEALRETASKTETIPDPGTAFLIVLTDEVGELKHYLIHFGAPDMMQSMRKISSSIRFDSSSKAAIYFSDFERRPQTFLMDYDYYNSFSENPDIASLEELFYRSPSDLAPTKLINPKGGLPLICFYINATAEDLIDIPNPTIGPEEIETEVPTTINSEDLWKVFTDAPEETQIPEEKVEDAITETHFGQADVVTSNNEEHEEFTENIMVTGDAQPQEEMTTTTTEHVDISTELFYEEIAKPDYDHGGAGSGAGFSDLYEYHEDHTRSEEEYHEDHTDRSEPEYEDHTGRLNTEYGEDHTGPSGTEYPEDHTGRSDTEYGEDHTGRSDKEYSEEHTAATGEGNETTTENARAIGESSTDVTSKIGTGLPEGTTQVSPDGTSNTLSSEGVTGGPTSSDGVIGSVASSDGESSDGTSSVGLTSEGAVSTEAAGDGVSSKEAVSEGAVGEGGALTTGAVSEGAVSEGAASEGVPSEGTVSEAAPSEAPPAKRRRKRQVKYTATIKEPGARRIKRQNEYISKEGLKTTVCINQDDAESRKTVISLSDPYAVDATRLVLDSRTGERTVVYLRKNDPATKKHLLRLTRKVATLGLPATNLQSHIVMRIRDSSNTIYIATFDTVKPETITALKDMSVQAPKNAPGTVFLGPAFENYVVHLDTTSDGVIRTLLATAISVEIAPGDPSSGYGVLIFPPHLINLNNALVREILLNTPDTKSTSCGIVTVSIPDANGIKRTKKFDMDDMKTLEMLQSLSIYTPSNLQTLQLPSGKVNHPYLIISLEDEQSEHSFPVILDTSSDLVVDALIQIAGYSSHDSTFLPLYDSFGNKKRVFLDFGDPLVRTRLQELNMRFQLPKTLIPNLPSTERYPMYLMVPIEQTDAQTVIAKCDVSRISIVDKLLRIPGKCTRGAPGTAFHILSPATGKPMTIYWDLQHSVTIRRVKEICEEILIRPDSNSLIILQVEIESELKLIALDPNHSPVKDLFNKISQQTVIKDTTKTIPIISSEGVVGAIKINLEDNLVSTLIQKALQEGFLIYSSPPVQKNNLVIITVPKADGSYEQIILDISDPYIVEILNRNDESMKSSATKIDFMTPDGKFHSVYIDLNDPRITETLKIVATPSLPPDPYPQPPVVNTPPISSADAKIGSPSDTTTEGGESDVLPDQQEREVERTKPDISPGSPIHHRLPPPAGANQIAICFVDSEGHTNLLHFNIDDLTVREALIDESVKSNKDKPNVVLKIPDETGALKSIRLETNDNNVLARLTEVAFKTEIVPDPGSLIIIQLEEPDREVLIFDIGIQSVLDELHEMSGRTKLDEATHLFTANAADGIRLIKINIKEHEQLTTIKDLASRTPSFIRPVQVPDPFGEIPFICFTILDANSEPLQIVLDVSDSHVHNQLKRLTSEEPLIPFVISYTNLADEVETFVFDIADKATTDGLNEISRQVKLPTDAMKNFPNVNAGLSTSINLPIESDSGRTDTYIFDVAVDEIYMKLLQRSRKTPRIKTCVLLYIPNEQKKTVVIRFDLADKSNPGAKVVATQLDIKYVIAFLVKKFDDTTDVIVLDKSVRQVYDALVEMSKTQIQPPYSIINFHHHDGYPVELKLNLHNEATIEKLRLLEVYTSKPFKPINLPNTLGSKPVTLFTIPTYYDPYEIVVLDQNDRFALERADELFSEVHDARGVSTVDKILNNLDLFNSNEAIAEEFQSISDGTLAQDTPLMSLPDYLYVTVVDKKNELLKVILDTSDPVVVDVLMSMSKDVVTSTEVAKVSVLDPRTDSVLLVQFRPKDKDGAIESIKELSLRTMYAARFMIRPPAGLVPYLVFSVPSKTLITNVNATLNVNDGTVVYAAILSSRRLKTSTIPRFLVKGLKREKVKIPIDLDDLKAISGLSAIQINPTIVIPPYGRAPLLSILIPRGTDQYCVTVNPNDESTFKELESVSTQSPKNATTITFFIRKRKKVHVYLQLEDDKVLATLQSLSKRSPLKIIPNRQRYPVIKATVQGGNELILDTGNKYVIEQLVKVSKSFDYSLTEIELRNADGYVMPVWLPLISGVPPAEDEVETSVDHQPWLQNPDGDVHREQKEDDTKDEEHATEEVIESTEPSDTHVESSSVAVVEEYPDYLEDHGTLYQDNQAKESAHIDAKKNAVEEYYVEVADYTEYTAEEDKDKDSDQDDYGDDDPLKMTEQGDANDGDSADVEEPSEVNEEEQQIQADKEEEPRETEETDEEEEVREADYEEEEAREVEDVTEYMGAADTTTHEIARGIDDSTTEFSTTSFYTSTIATTKMTKEMSTTGGERVSGGTETPTTLSATGITQVSSEVSAVDSSEASSDVPATTIASSDVSSTNEPGSSEAGGSEGSTEASSSEAGSSEAAISSEAPSSSDASSSEASPTDAATTTMALAGSVEPKKRMLAYNVGRRLRALTDKPPQLEEEVPAEMFVRMLKDKDLILNELMQLAMFYQIPDVYVTLQLNQPSYYNPIKILPHGGTYPLILTHIEHTEYQTSDKVGPLSLDINDSETLKLMREMSSKVDVTEEYSLIEVPDLDGNIVGFRVDFTDLELLQPLIEISKKSYVQFKPVPYKFPILMLNDPNGVITINMNDDRMIKYLKTFTLAATPTAYWMELPQGLEFDIIRIDFKEHAAVINEKVQSFNKTRQPPRPDPVPPGPSTPGTTTTSQRPTTTTIEPTDRPEIEEVETEPILPDGMDEIAESGKETVTAPPATPEPEETTEQEVTEKLEEHIMEPDEGYDEHEELVTSEELEMMEITEESAVTEESRLIEEFEEHEEEEHELEEHELEEHEPEEFEKPGITEEPSITEISEIEEHKEEEHKEDAEKPEVETEYHEPVTIRDIGTTEGEIYVTTESLERGAGGVTGGADEGTGGTATGSSGGPEGTTVVKVDATSATGLSGDTITSASPEFTAERAAGESDTDSTESSSEADLTSPAGDLTSPAGDQTSPSGDQTSPSGDQTSPSGDITTLSVDQTNTEDEITQSSETGTESEAGTPTATEFQSAEILGDDRTRDGANVEEESTEPSSAETQRGSETAEKITAEESTTETHTTEAFIEEQEPFIGEPETIEKPDLEHTEEPEREEEFEPEHAEEPEFTEEPEHEEELEHTEEPELEKELEHAEEPGEVEHTEEPEELERKEVEEEEELERKEEEEEPAELERTEEPEKLEHTEVEELVTEEVEGAPVEEPELVGTELPSEETEEPEEEIMTEKLEKATEEGLTEEIQTEMPITALPVPDVDEFPVIVPEVYHNSWYWSQWYPSINNVRYNITIDTNNHELVESLTSFSEQSTQGLDPDSNSIVVLKYVTEHGKPIILMFNKWDPKSLDLLTHANIISIGQPPNIERRIQSKMMFHFTFVDMHGRQQSYTLDINNKEVIKKLKLLEGWATELADPDDLFDVVMDGFSGESHSFKLDLNNPITQRNLEVLKEESLTEMPAKLHDPTKRRRSSKRSLDFDFRSGPLPMSVDLDSPYTGPFTAIFDIGRRDVVKKFEAFNQIFKDTKYLFEITVQTPSNPKYMVKLDMTNPKIVYELIVMTKSFVNYMLPFKPEIILRNLVTLEIPEDNFLITFDISDIFVLESLVRLNDSNFRGTEVAIPYGGDLARLYLDVTNPRIVADLRSFATPTVIPGNNEKTPMITLIFLDTASGLKPVTVDLSDRNTILTVLNIIRSNPRGEEPTYLEIQDDTGQFLTISLDLNNPNVVRSLADAFKPSWFVNIDARRSPYLILCLPSGYKYQVTKLRLKPVIIDELSVIPGEYSPEFTLLQILDSRGKTTEVYLDPRRPELAQFVATVPNSAEILSPHEHNAFIVYNPDKDEYIDIDLKSAKSRKLLKKLEREYDIGQPLTIVKHSGLAKEKFFFISLSRRTVNELKTFSSDLGAHLTIKQELVHDSVLNVPLGYGKFLPIRLDLANKDILSELEKLTGAGRVEIDTVDAFGYPLKLNIDPTDKNAINNLISLATGISAYD